MMSATAKTIVAVCCALALAGPGCSKEDAPSDEEAREAPAEVAPPEHDAAPPLPSKFSRTYGPVVTAFKQLLDADCDPEAIRVNTAVEARILRHTPYAVEGAVPDDPALVRLFSTESWFRGPEAPRPGLEGRELPILPEHERCAERLEEYERSLRDAHPSPFPEELEAIVTGHSGIYFSLRELAMIGYERDKTPTRLRHHSARRDGDAWVWKLEVLDEPGEEYVTVRCDEDAGEWDCDFRVDAPR